MRTLCLALICTLGALAGSTDERISLYEKRAAMAPASLQFKTQLAAAYIQKVRETYDFQYLDRASKLVNAVLQAQPSHREALQLRNRIELSQHHFAEAAAYARQMTEAFPPDAQAWGTLGDALMELGRYDEAKAAYEHMAALGRTLFSLNRLAYHRFVTGDASEAIRLMQQAVAAGPPMTENRAWCLAELGAMYFKTGQLSSAEKAYREAIETFPGLASAHAGLGAVLAAQGDLNGAVESYRKAQASVPLVNYTAALHDLYRRTGKPEEAKQQEALIDVVAKLEAAAGQKANRTLALVYADENRKLPEALALVQADLKVRQDVYTYDALAWVLYKNGKLTEARAAVEQALRCHTPEPQFYIHASQIARAQGDDAAAGEWAKMAQTLNPKFDTALTAALRP